MSRSIRHGSLWPAQADDESSVSVVTRALYDLRYSAAEVELAEAEGRRARPQRVRPATENPCSRGRCGDFALINGVYAAAQSSVRTAERAALGELRKLANSGAGAADSGAGAADGVDFGERANGRRAAW
ncbi:hypothetical protein KGQ19_36875 [Catenulispora sp. NL8]|uniref:Uncharacterized protein n=1 Tax=Catenulispora pinistramenti TaxID=2705254 RepID=A0ABS5L280_9ACTN|nr:hypothetical protein [Catenulispora pinistramenti]MBS2552442.1 hypothetical protein [Catenulispora pinistramenti]